ncbi:MAG: arginine--tRNA ligase, partial [Candidatus Poseidoniaceae archaeon]|nr:arginine--tRNA ligase [Candidatus Poseidoniaceae archaeon]
INFVHTFVPSMIEQNNPCVVVNTGSKQGITKPPGDTAYNISKAGVITLTEGLEHKFRSTEGCNITAFLLIPGWVNSMLSYKTNRRLNGDSFDEKTVRFHEEGKQHEGQWTPKQTTDLMFAAIENGAPFYIMCPDNDMTNDMMHAGVQWGSNDITMSRPPLSRWHDDYKEDIERAIAAMVHASENGDYKVLASFENAYQPVLDGMLQTLGRLGIYFDEFTKESLFVTNGDVSKVMQKLTELDIHGVADNGAEYLDLGARGLKGKTEFYFRRGDGSSLYATRDIAYHIWKFTQCDNLINILGEDHKLQSKQVSLTLNEMGYQTPEVLFYSFIKLPEGKMSTRRGNVVFMDDLLEEAKAHAAEVVKEIRTDYTDQQISKIAEAVGTSAVRFNIIKVSPDKGFTFRWEEALSFDSDSAPFIMYSHTRSRSIAKKCHDLGVDLSRINDIDTSNIPDSMYELLRIIACHNDVLARSVKQNRPNLFASQLLNLANYYNGFYRDCKVIQGGKVNHSFLAISEIASQLLKSGMIGLGITPLEQM